MRLDDGEIFLSCLSIVLLSAHVILSYEYVKGLVAQNLKIFIETLFYNIFQNRAIHVLNLYDVAFISENQVGPAGNLKKIFRNLLKH